MPKKSDNIYSTEWSLPRLGIQPYLKLMDRTAGEATERSQAPVGLLMLWVGDHVLDIMDEALAGFGITESKLDLLLLLSLHEHQELVTPSALADRMGIRRSSITALLNWLETRSWIIREPYAKDGRKTHVRISDEGKALIQQLLPTFWSTCASITDDLEAEERELLSSILLKLNKSAEVRLNAGR